MLKRIMGALLVIALVTAGGAAAAWKRSPSFREKLLLAALLSQIPEVQRAAATELRDYPTALSALSLVAFVNLKHQPPLDTRRLERSLEFPERASEGDLSELAEFLARWDCLPEAADSAALGEMPRDEREAIAACMAPKLELAEEARERDAELAERAFLSLCVLTGHSFGTHYEETRGGFSWGSLSDSRWQLARNQLNAWAFETFGAESVGRLAAAAADWSDAELEVEIR